MNPDARGEIVSTRQRPMALVIMGRIASRAVQMLVISCISLAVRAGQVHRYASFVPPPIYDSFQIRHVAITALTHVLTLGYWPKTFGNDVQQVPPYSNGWTMDQLIMLTFHAQLAYAGWVRAWTVVIVLLIGAFGISALRKRVRASQRDTTHEGA